MTPLANPPVIEVVLGVQFVTLPKLTSGHYGRFWAQHLEPEEWTETNDAGPIPEQFELFDPRPVWGQPQVSWMLTGPEAPRVMFRSADGDRLIQLQPNRFVYNWQRRGAGYPSYRRVFEAFERYFDRFEVFVRDHKLGALLPNQWEVTYVDRVPPGELWRHPGEWHRVIPGLLAPTPAGVAALDGVNGEWHFNLPDGRGRLHLAIGQGPADRPGQEPALVMRTTVRGPVGGDGTADWRAGLELGHAAAGNVFFAVTSTAAHVVWGKKS